MVKLDGFSLNSLNSSFLIKGSNDLYAVGDICDSGLPELTPVAIKQGEVCANEIAKNNTSTISSSINNNLNDEGVPSTVFTTPSEYSRIGFGEEAAGEQFGVENVVAYLKEWQNLEVSAVSYEASARCFVKLVCVKNKDEEKVVGIHIVAPGEKILM